MLFRSPKFRPNRAEEEEQFSLKGKIGIKARQNQGSFTHATNKRPTHVHFLKSSCFAFKTKSQILRTKKIRIVMSNHIPKIVQVPDDQGMGAQLTGIKWRSSSSKTTIAASKSRTSLGARPRPYRRDKTAFTEGINKGHQDS